MQFPDGDCQQYRIDTPILYDLREIDCFRGDESIRRHGAIVGIVAVVRKLEK
jgi:hypothetical protein